MGLARVRRCRSWRGIIGSSASCSRRSRCAVPKPRSFAGKYPYAGPFASARRPAHQTA
jgi:hypothetical protein